MNDNHLREAILENGETIFSSFAVSDIFQDIQYLAEGEENYIYKVLGQKGTYVARILKPGNVRAKVDYQFEFGFQEYLRSHEIPAPRQYKTTNNDFEVTHTLGGSTLQVTLYDFVAGKTITAPNVRHIEIAAKLLGRLHNLAPGFNPEYDRLEQLDTLNWLTDTTKTPKPNTLAEEAFVLYSRYGKAIRDNVRNLEKLPLHNDIHFGNLLFKGDDLTAVLDFDESHKYYIPLELGWSIGQLCNFGGPENFKNNLEVFLKAYLAQHQLSELESNVASAALIAETSRKLLKYPSDSLVIQQFKNVAIWEHGVPSMRALTASTDSRH